LQATRTAPIDHIPLGIVTVAVVIEAIANGRHIFSLSVPSFGIRTA
jgi:hypothetical protein